MKRRTTLVFAVAALIGAAPAASAPPQVQARAYLVQNAATGEVLASRNASTPLPIASITKLMTVLVTLDRATLDDVVTVSRGAAAVGESTIFLRVGERIEVGDLVRAALVQSANDAATALAAHVGGGSVDRFVGLMNAKARELRLRDTYFKNPDGLDMPGHVSSARDVTRLAQIAMRDPFVRATVRLETVTIAGGRRLRTWNDLLGAFPRTIGVKTGHPDDAGWSEVAAAQGRGTTIYATILGGPSRERRNADLRRLLAWGLARYRVVPAVSTDRVYATAAAPYGLRPVGLVAQRSLLRVARLGRPFVEQVVAPTTVSLPVHVGQRLGEVRILSRGTVVAVAPLVATEARERPGRLSRARFYARRTLHHLKGLIT